MERLVKALLFAFVGASLVFLLSCNNNLQIALHDKIEMDETTPPVPGGDGVIAAAPRAGAITVSWSPATDNLVPQENLEYQVICSATDNIGSHADALLNMDADKSSAWLPGAVSGDAINLEDLTTYYLNVLVRDRGGNIAIYRMIQSQTGVDPDPPMLSNGNTISPVAIAEESFEINWPQATDAMTPQNLLQYSIYYSKNDDVTDWDDIENGTTALSTGWQIYAAVSKTVDVSVSDNTTYYVNVLVRDERDNRKAYQRITFKTKGLPRIYWVEYANGRIRRALTDGSNPQLIADRGVGSYPYAIALDSANRIAYWSEHGAERISCANMDDGTFIGNVVTSNVGDVYGLAFDARNNTLYWSSASKIYNAPASTRDGNANSFAVAAIAPYDAENALNGITIDPATNKLYWIESDEVTGAHSRICSADINSSTPPVVSNPALFYNNTMMLPRAIALDSANFCLFWSDVHSDSPYPRISKINTDKTNYIGSITSGLSSVFGIVSYYNPTIPASYFFWTDAGTDTIHRAPTSTASGNAASFTLSINTSSGDPMGIALDVPSN